MAQAIFGISNSGLNLVVNLLVLMLVVVWLALIVYTYLDARRRISDPFLIGCATIGSFIPYVGTAVYAIVRPPEFLEDARERALEIKAAELRVHQLKELSCPGCGFPIERSYLRCPRCQRHLKDPCPSCRKPVDPRWALCPYCTKALPGQERRQERSEESRRQPREERAPRRQERAASKRQPPRKSAAAPPAGNDSARTPSAKKPPSPRQPQRSPGLEPDPDPLKA
jgi:hypothetical protein